MIDDYRLSLHHRWMEGCTNAPALTREIQHLGCRGDINTVPRHLRPYRTGTIPTDAPLPHLTVRRVTDWITRRLELPTETERKCLGKLCEHSPALATTVVKMRPGNVIVVAGRPAMGKSAFTLGAALANADSGRPTLVHSMEMGEAEVLNRVLASWATLGLHHPMDGGPAIEDNDWTRMQRVLPDLTQLPLWMDHAARVSPSRVRHRIKALARETGRTPLVIIDYLQLMETDQSNGRQTPYERVSEISRELKIIAEETGAASSAAPSSTAAPNTARANGRWCRTSALDNCMSTEPSQAVVWALLLHLVPSAGERTRVRRRSGGHS
ncbi:DnaB-like helicase C-terminal domain-containing protein [Streptomyces sp. NPDC052101]|uniref:DnaB-like helicase C-terminal domain-containing protein n=1 Tax=Streptomyces sp. NPDC052101 TaxID=3155763 RepID=UPI003432E2D2